MNRGERSVVVVGMARTAVGKFGGAFSNVDAYQLGASAVRAAASHAGMLPSDIQELVMGQVGQVGPDAYNARRVALEAGLPTTSTAFNVNRLCSSGLQAIWTAVDQIRSGQFRIVAAGGNENMTRQPFLEYQARDGYSLGHRTLLDGTLSLVTDPFGHYAMGCTAEEVASRFGVSRRRQDAFALRSQERALRAIDEGRFVDQIVGVEVRDRKGVRFVDQDEHPRQNVTLEKLAELRPAFRDGGTVTAGNASGISDGAAAVVLMSEEDARARQFTPIARFVGAAVVGVDPEIMGIGPIGAVRALLDQTGVSLADIDVVELNEAFAAQAVAVIDELELDEAKVNPNGGAISLGHPVGATGAILTVKLIAELERMNGKYGIVTMCIGGGQGMAALFERVNT